jgi:hypothetical protein
VEGVHDGYEGHILPLKYRKASTHRHPPEPNYEINIEHIPAVVHTQLLFKYPGAKGTSVLRKNYRPIVQYMAETIGIRAMELIVDAVMCYVEYTGDDYLLPFAITLSEQIGKEGSMDIIRLPK